VVGPKPLCDPVCFLVHLRQLHPGEALARIRPVRGALLPLALPPFDDDLAGLLRSPIFGAEFRLGADVLQLGFPGANPFFLREGQVEKSWTMLSGWLESTFAYVLDRRPEL
jgi:hypothetical protein